MKNKFSGYYGYTKSALSLLVQKAIIILDYSLLLDINTLSHGRLILELLSEKYADRLWLPYDTAWMYHQRIQETIKDQITKTDIAKKHLTAFINAVDDKKNHPYIKENLIKQYRYLTRTMTDALEKESSYLYGSLYRNDIKEKIANLFDGKIGEEYNEEELNMVIEEAKSREKKDLPPCCVICKDFEDNRMKYHYYIMWKQIIKESMTKSAPILLLTNSITENWFVNYNDRIITTRHELRSDFQQQTGNEFFCFSMCDFIKKFDRESVQKSEYEKLIAQLCDTPHKAVANIVKENSSNQI